MSCTAQLSLCLVSLPVIRASSLDDPPPHPFMLWTIVPRLSGPCPLGVGTFHQQDHRPAETGPLPFSRPGGCVGQRFRDLPWQQLIAPPSRAIVSRQPLLNICCTLLVYVAGWSSRTLVFPRMGHLSWTALRRLLVGLAPRVR